MVWYAFNGGQGGALNEPWERWREILGLGPSVHLAFHIPLLMLSALVWFEGEGFDDLATGMVVV